MTAVLSSCSTLDSAVNNQTNQPENIVTVESADVSPQPADITANPETLRILAKETLNWTDCINIAKNETKLLDFITWGRAVSDAELFDRLIDRAFIPYSQSITSTNWSLAKPTSEETVTRAGAAFFIWHIYAEARSNPRLLSLYAARYANQPNPVSPIADVPVRSPFFNSILGSIEMEFLSLTDDRNFSPAQPIRGAELLAILRKIEN